MAISDWYQAIDGLFHFDGATFERLERIESATVAADGAIDLIIRTGGGRALHGRITAWSDAIIRLQIAEVPPGPWPSTMLVQEAAGDAGEAVIGTGDIAMRTPSFTLRIEREPWRVVLEDADGRPLVCEERSDRHPSDPGARIAQPFGIAQRDGLTWMHAAMEMAPDEAFYGLGEKYGPLDRRGQQVHCFCRGNGTWSEGDHKSIPFVMSSRGYGVFSHSFHPQGFAMGTVSTAAWNVAVAEPRLDLFFMGGDHHRLLASYTWLTGRPRLPPAWAFGIWMSRCTYRSRAEVEAVATRMRELGLPCDVLRLDTGWFHRDGRGSALDFDFTWNEETFPDPSGFAAWLGERGFRLALFINSWSLSGSEISEEARRFGFLVQRPDGGEYSWSMGRDCPVVAFDLSLPACRAWYKGRLKRLLAQGVTTFHVDWGIGAPLQAVYAAGDAVPYNNLHGLLYNQVVHEAMEEHFGRPWAAPGITGAPGIQRYAWTYAGDSRTTFRDFATVVRGSLSSALSGISYWGCDIGGFGSCPDERPDRRLYVRSIQHGFLLPFANLHGIGEREPWFYGEDVVMIYRRYAELRYRLLPYIITIAWMSTQSGLPMLRPMVLEFPDDPTTRHLDLQYLLGGALLVAPIVDERDERDVYLPAGGWFDHRDGSWHEGGRWLRVHADLETMPLFVRAGSILPLGPAVDRLGIDAPRAVAVEVYPRAGVAEGGLFADGRLHRLRWWRAADGDHLDRDGYAGDLAIIVRDPSPTRGS